MNTAEIVKREVQSDSGFQVRQLFAERIREARKTAHRHAHREILPLHKRRADLIGVRITSANFGYNLRDSWWGVPRIGALAVALEEFHELREVNIRPEALRNAHRVVVESVRGE